MRTLPLVLAVLIGVAGCAAPSDRFGFPVTCEEPVSDDECGRLVQFAVDNGHWDRNALGEIREMTASMVPDCAKAARAGFQPELADPGFDKCWRVQVRWQRGERAWYVARYSVSGEVRLFD